MKNSIMKYILIVSLLMNFSLLGTAAYTHYRQARYHHHTAPSLGQGGIRGAHAPCGPGMFFEALSLKPEQVKLFRQKATAFHKDLDKKRQEVDGLRVSLLALMRADNPDGEAIRATIARINKEQEEIQKAVVSHMLEFKSMLDRDQQKKFMVMIEGAMGEGKETACP